MRMDVNENMYYMTEDQRSNINKRLPVGFSLTKLTQRDNWHSTPFRGEIKYIPQKPQLRTFAKQTNANQFPVPVTAPSVAKQRPGLLVHSPRQATLKKDHPKLGSDFVTMIKSKSMFQAPQNKSRQAQKIKNIIQRLRKHPKFQSFGLHMTKLGFYSHFADVEAESKRNLLTIDVFKERCMHIFTSTRNATYVHQTLEMIDQMIEQFIFYVDQAKRTQFSNSLTAIQKSIDKITRQFSDIKEQGSWYLRKKKKSERNFDEKQVLYIADLIKQLPEAYLIGIWEIIQEKPFPESFCSTLEVDLRDLKQKKLRQIEAYVKRKLINLNKSRLSKIQKIAKKKLEKFTKEREQKMNKQEQSESEKQQKHQGESNIDYFRTPNRSQAQVLALAQEKIFQDSKNEARSQLSHGNNPQMPPTPQFNPKKNKDIPTFQNLKAQSLLNNIFYQKEVKKNNQKENLIQQIFVEYNQLKYPNQQQDDFLGLNDFEKESNALSKQEPHIIDSPLWNQPEQSDLIKDRFQNDRYKNEEKQEFEPLLEFQPLSVMPLKKEEIGDQRQKSEAMNPPSFDQGQQFANSNHPVKLKEQNQNDDNEQQENSQDSSFTSSNSSMITDEDDSQF